MPDISLNETKSPVPNFKKCSTVLFPFAFTSGSISTIPGHELVIDLIKYFSHFLPSKSSTKKSSPKSVNKKDDKPNCAA